MLGAICKDRDSQSTVRQNGVVLVRILSIYIVVVEPRSTAQTSVAMQLAYTLTWFAFFLVNVYTRAEG